MKNRLLALFMTAVLLLTAIGPVYAAETDAPDGVPETPASAGKEESSEGEEAPSEDEEPSEEKKEDSEEGEPSKDEEETPEEGEDAEEPEVPDLEAGTVVAGVSLVSDRHIAYALGNGKAMASFNPWREVTRAEAAVMLFRLLPDETPVPSPGAVSFTDVPDTAWYADAVRTLGALGVMRPGETECNTGEAITRGEFIRYLACFFPLRDDAQQFPDVPADSPDAPYIRSARAYGWTLGDKDGLFHPENTITRAELTVMVNRALGRVADKAYIDRTHPTFYVDVSPDLWFYYDIIEASVYHTHTSEGSAESWTNHTAKQNVPPVGFQLVDGWLYYYSANQGDVLRNTNYEGHDFNAAGRFTSGNDSLDAKLRTIVLNKTNSSMTQEQMLRALYVYTRDSFTYLRRPAYEFGAQGYMMEDALRILNTGYGNCYCYASLFWYLSRWIGYDARIYSGTVGQNRAPHSWVEITMDGTSYIFDTELEMAYRLKKRYDVNLYKFNDTRNSWRYVRPEQPS
ncbi:MAG: hypothetical protein HFF84_13480 [Oscillibacter sp.]|nr:hypothetical protein [Oscillibacter sp.]